MCIQKAFLYKDLSFFNYRKFLYHIILTVALSPFYQSFSYNFSSRILNLLNKMSRILIIFLTHFYHFDF